MEVARAVEIDERSSRSRARQRRLGRSVESVRLTKFYGEGLLPGLGCGPCGLSDRVAMRRARLQGAILEPSLSVFLNSWQGLFLTTYPQVILRLVFWWFRSGGTGLFSNEAAKITSGRNDLV